MEVGVVSAGVVTDAEKDETKEGVEFKSDAMSPPDCNLIVNYIPTSYNDDDLRKIFTSYGNIVKLKIVRDYQTKHSLGYGFVVFDNKDSADAAINALNGFALENKRLKVSVAKPPQKETEKEWTNLYVSGLPKTFTAEQLQKVISVYGVVRECRLLYDPVTKSPRGVGFARLDSKENAQKAIKGLSGFVPEGASTGLQVKFADTPAESAKRRHRSRYGPILQGPTGRTTDYPSHGDRHSYGDRMFDINDHRSLAYNMASDRMSHGSLPPSAFLNQLNHLSQNSLLKGSGYNPLLSPFVDSPSSLSMNLLGLGAPLQSNLFDSMGPIVPPSPVGSTSSGGFSNGGVGALSKQSVAAATTATSGVAFSGTCLFVYHLPPDATEQTLWQLFAGFGSVVSTKVMKDLRTSQSKGFGFVNMLSESEAQMALQALNGYQLGSKRLKVSIKTNK